MEPPCLANIRDILSARENHRNWEKKENIETEHNEEQTETASHSKTFGRRTSVEKIVVIPELNVVSHLQSEEEDVDSCRQNWSEQDNLQTIHDSSVSIKTEPHMECQSQMMEKCFEDYKIAAESLDNCKTEDMPDTLQNWGLPIGHVDPAKLRSSCTSCPSCDFSSSDMNLFKEHIESHSRSTDKTYNCKICGYSCAGSFKLKKHMQEHSDNKLHCCNLCDYTCSEDWRLKRHVKVHTGDRSHSCPICGYTGPDSWKLKRHMRIHTGEKPFSCSCCDYCSSDSWKVKRHMRVHSALQNWSLPIGQVDPAKLRSCTSCPNCDFETSDMNLFKEHIESHSRSTVETYNCKVCGLICGGSFHLSKHMKEHADDNLYFCDSCDYTCSEEWQLKNHVKVHNTGCRTFSCSICGYRGPDSWKLRRHMRIHTGEKPYGCSCCNYCSSDSWKVKRHMQVHTRKKNF